MSLRAKTFVRSVALSVFLIVMIMAAYTYYMLHFHHRMMDERYISDIAIRATEVERLMLWYDRAAVTKLLESVNNADDCVAYTFVEREGRPYAQTFPDGVPRMLLGRPASPIPEEWRFKDENGAHFHDISIQVGDTDAVLHIGLSVDEMTNGIAPLVARIAAAGTVTFLAAILLSIFLARSTTREVNSATVALRTSEERYRAIAEDMPVLICRFLPDSKITYVNAACCRFFAKTCGELVGASFLSLIPEADPETAMANISALTVDSPTQLHEHELIAAGDNIRWQRWTTRALFDAQGKAVAYQSIGEDITERKRSEEFLREERDRAQSYLDMAGTVILAIDETEKVSLVNKKGCQLLGATEDEIIGKNWFDTFLPEGHRKDAREVFTGLMNGNVEPLAHVEGFAILSSSNEERFMSWHNSVITSSEGRIVGTLSSGEDITERKRTEESLRLFTSLTNQANDAIFAIDPETSRFLHVNEKAKKSLGYTNEELLEFGVSDIDAFIPSDFSWSDHAREVAAAGSITLEGQHKRKNGTTFPVEVNVKYIVGQERDYMVAIARDITERKRAEDALRKERDFAETLLNTAQAIMLVLDVEGRVVRFNPYMEQLSGYSLAEVQGKDWFDTFLPARDHAHIRTVFQKAVGDIHTMGNINSIVTKNGSEREIEWYGKTLKDAHGNVEGVVSVGLDITERKRAEEQALQRQAELAHVLRLGTMGEMASGIAHELNQPLAAITSYAGACVRRVDPAGHNGEKLIENLGQIREQAERAGEIIRRLRRLVRKQSPQREAGDIKAIVSEPLSLLHYAARQSSVTMRMDVDDQIPELMVDSVQIQQVILNLCRNSIEAMSEADTQKRELLVRAARLNGAAIEVSVDDTGPGLPDEGGEALFQSFVSTKSNGLGLSISRSIVEAHGGRLWATTDPNGGATFRFTLPIAESEPTHGA